MLFLQKNKIQNVPFFVCVVEVNNLLVDAMSSFISLTGSRPNQEHAKPQASSLDQSDPDISDLKLGKPNWDKWSGETDS